MNFLGELHFTDRTLVKLRFRVLVLQQKGTSDVDRKQPSAVLERAVFYSVTKVYSTTIF